MEKLRFISRFIRISMARLCHRQGLLAMLLAACLILPLCIAPAMEQFFSKGVSFSGITLAITAPEGDPVPALLEELLPGMKDVSQYCQVRAMDKESAVEGLKSGEITAVLVLPEGFVQGVLEGSNPDVELIVPADRPLEAMLTLWVGQSAADLLASAQSAIYAVLDLYAQNPVPDLDYGQVVTQINLRFINWTLSRQDMFRMEQLEITDTLPIGLHYGSSLLCFLALSMVPFFYTLFENGWIRAQRRLLVTGKSVFTFWGCSAAACWCLMLVILVPGCWIISKGSFWLCLAAGGLTALFAAAFALFCCTVSDHLGSCGLLSTLSGVVLLALSGGILPPVMMPQVLRSATAYTPISWMRDLMGWSAGYPAVRPIALILLIGISAALLFVSFLAYRSRFLREVQQR